MSYRVLHVLDHSWPVLSGYSIRSLSIVAGQRKCGFLPSVVTGPLHQLDNDSAEDGVFDGIQYWRTTVRSGFGNAALQHRWAGLREAVVVQALKERIGELLDRNTFDVVHAHSPALCGLAAFLASRSRKIPFIYEIRAFWEDAAVDLKRAQQGGLRYRLIHGLETFVAKRADAVVGIATHILQDLETRGIDPRKLFHVPNGVDADKFFPAPKDTALAAQLGLSEAPVLGFIGSLYRYEGICWLVRAAAELRRSGTDFQLLIVGDGEDLPKIEEEISANGAQDYVRALGRVPHDEIKRYYSLIDIMVYPRLSMRLTELVTPLKPLEAMAQAKATLASGVGGLRELIDHGNNGYLFIPENIDDFFRKARELIGSPDLRFTLGAQARRHILEQKDWKVLANCYNAVYDHARSTPRVVRACESHPSGN